MYAFTGRGASNGPPVSLVCKANVQSDTLAFLLVYTGGPLRQKEIKDRDRLQMLKVTTTPELCPFRGKQESSVKPSEAHHSPESRKYPTAPIIALCPHANVLLTVT